MKQSAQTVKKLLPTDYDSDPRDTNFFLPRLVTITPSRRSAAALSPRRSSSVSSSTASPPQSPASASSSLSSQTTPPSSPVTTSPRIVFGPGSIARLPTELGRLHLSSPLIVSSPSRIQLAKAIQARIPNLDSCILNSSVLNTSSRAVDESLDRITGRDCVISVGGGSALALAQELGLRKGIAHICVPTTYCGSEASVSRASASRRRRSDKRRSGGAGSSRSSTNSNRIRPAVIIYDEDLTMSAVTKMSVPATEAINPVHPRRCTKHDIDDSWGYLHLPGV